MCTASTAKRRRSQAKNNYMHMAPLKRPHYHKIDAKTSQRRLFALIEKERRMQQGKNKKK